MLMGVATFLLAACTALTPPSGRPPQGPLQRHDPKVYDFTFDVTVTTLWQIDARNQRFYDLADAPIVMPVIFQGTYSQVNADSLRARLWLMGREDLTLNDRTRLDDGFPFHTRLAVLPIVRFTGSSLRWSLGYRVQVWSSKLTSEQAAASLAWPREWPQEVADGLRPQKFIESDDPIFKETVDRVSGGKLRMVPPYLAAKDLVRYCVNEVRVSGNGVSMGLAGALHGLEMVGARQTAIDGTGSPHDLVCVCVAMLRAAGIPARPVIGVEKRPVEERRPGGRRTQFRSWAEFYLPQAGWVPFDPMEMRGRVRNVDVRRAWKGFGTIKELNRRIPLAYHFIPPTTVESPQRPSVWGWDPRPGGDPSSEQRITFKIVSRGRGVDDPK